MRTSDFAGIRTIQCPIFDTNYDSWRDRNRGKNRLHFTVEVVSFDREYYRQEISTQCLYNVYQFMDREETILIQDGTRPRQSCMKIYEAIYKPTIALNLLFKVPISNRCICLRKLTGRYIFALVIGRSVINANHKSIAQ